MSSMINLNKESKLQSSVLEQIDIINRKLEAKRENLSNLINSIVAKEKRLAKRISANKGETNLTVSNTFSSFDSKRSNLIDTSEIEVKDIIDNKDYLSRRQNELEEIKVISSQIREMSISMQSDTIRQRNDLSQIEHDINQANSFAHKTELEMQIAEKDTRASNRRMWCIVLFVFFTAVAVVTLLFLLIPKSS